MCYKNAHNLQKYFKITYFIRFYIDVKPYKRYTFHIYKRGEYMDAGTIIIDQIGISNLLGFAAREYKTGRGNRVSHCGYLEFVASKNPKLPQLVKVRIELNPDETYMVGVIDVKTSEVLDSRSQVFGDDLVDILDDIFG